MQRFFAASASAFLPSSVLMGNCASPFRQETHLALLPLDRLRARRDLKLLLLPLLFRLGIFQLAQTELLLDLELLVFLVGDRVVLLQSLHGFELLAGELVLLLEALDLQFDRFELHRPEPDVFLQLPVDVNKGQPLVIILALPISLGRLDLLVDDIGFAQPFVVTVQVGQDVPLLDQAVHIDRLTKAERAGGPQGRRPR